MSDELKAPLYIKGPRIPNTIKMKKPQSSPAERMARAYDKIKDTIPEKNRIDD